MQYARTAQFIPFLVWNLFILQVTALRYTVLRYLLYDHVEWALTLIWVSHRWENEENFADFLERTHGRWENVYAFLKQRSEITQPILLLFQNSIPRHFGHFAMHLEVYVQP